MGANLTNKAITRDVSPSYAEAFSMFSTSVGHHVHSTIGMLLLQVLIIIAFARLLGWLFTKIKQPAVIGEIIAGIILGPTLLGKVSPEVFSFLFPASSISNIELLSHFGLILFMFAIGMELRISDIKSQMRQSLIISHAGIFLPFILSLVVSYYIYDRYASNLTTFTSFALFIGISMSITAFPVLARIIQENNLSRKALGKLSLSSAAAGDITAWLMLAAIIAIAESGSMVSISYNMLFLVLYMLVMFGVIRPIFKIIGKIYDNSEVINHTLIGVIFILLLLSSYVTELLSMHALFGAFMFGLVMPEDLSFRKIVTDKIEDVSLLLFLPLFFVSSGLHTELGLINGSEMWTILGIFTAIAVFGKVFGTYIAARTTGENTKNSLYLGAFMNTRGLMELVVLSIGLELKVLPLPIFTVLVMMTIITTVMTMPMVKFISYIYKLLDKRKHKISINDKSQGLKVLISFGRPSSGASLLKLSTYMLNKGVHKASYTALHITTDLEINPIDTEKYYTDDFAPIEKQANKIGQFVCTDYVVSNNTEDTIINKLKQEKYNFLIVGAGLRLSNNDKDIEANVFRDTIIKRFGRFAINTGESILSVNGMLHDKTFYFLDKSPCSVGVFINRGMQNINNISVIIESNEDIKILPYARTMATNSSANINVITTDSLNISKTDMNKHDIITDDIMHNDYIWWHRIKENDFMFVSHSLWYKYFDTNQDLLKIIPSTIILKIK